MKHVKALSLILLLTVFSMPATAKKPDAAKAFQQLSGLVGNWMGKSESGRQHSVNYRLSAGGTVLVETWSLSSGRESMTMYHLDGDDLMATHYCPQGNQPRLLLVSDAGKMHFEFRDGTNLKVPDKAHQHSFWLQINDSGHFQRNEIYVDNVRTGHVPAEENPQDTFSYTRKDDSADTKK